MLGGEAREPVAEKEKKMVVVEEVEGTEEPQGNRKRGSYARSRL